MADESWKFRVKQTRSRGMTEEVVIVRGEWLYGQLAIWDQPAELLVGDTVKRIDRVYEKDQRERVPGEAVLHLYGVTVDDVPIGAVSQGRFLVTCRGGHPVAGTRPFPDPRSNVVWRPCWASTDCG